MPGASSVAAHWPVGSAVGSAPATVAPRMATVVPSTSVRAGRNASAASRPRPTTASGGSAVGRRRDGAEGAGQRRAAEVEGVVVRHRRHVDARGGKRGEGARGCLEDVPLAGRRLSAAPDRGLEVHDRDVGRGQGARRRGQRGGRVVQPALAARPRSGRHPRPRSSAPAARRAGWGWARAAARPGTSAPRCWTASRTARPAPAGRSRPAVIASTASATGTAPRRNDVMR